MIWWKNLFWEAEQSVDHHQVGTDVRKGLEILEVSWLHLSVWDVGCSSGSTSLPPNTPGKPRSYHLSIIKSLYMCLLHGECSVTVYSDPSDVLSGCGPSDLKLLACSCGLWPLLHHPPAFLLRREPSWSYSRWPFPNNSTNRCHLVTRLTSVILALMSFPKLAALTVRVERSE